SAVGPLNYMRVFIPPCVALFTTDCQRVTFDPQIHVVLRYTRQLCRDLQGFFRLVDVHSWAPDNLPAGCLSPASRASRGVFKEPIHFPMEIEERIPATRYSRCRKWKDKAWCHDEPP